MYVWYAYQFMMMIKYMDIKSANPYWLIYTLCNLLHKSIRRALLSRSPVHHVLSFLAVRFCRSDGRAGGLVGGQCSALGAPLAGSRARRLPRVHVGVRLPPALGALLVLLTIGNDTWDLECSKNCKSIAHADMLSTVQYTHERIFRIWIQYISWSSLFRSSWNLLASVMDTTISWCFDRW